MKTNPQTNNRPLSAYIRRVPDVYTSALPGYPQQEFGNPYTGFAEGLPVPYEAAQVPAAAGSAGSSFNLGQLKGLVDRMGGIEGIVGTMTKVQKFIANFQQMAPMIKLLMGSFGGGAKATAANANLGDYDGLPRGKRRKRRRRRSRKSPLYKGYRRQLSSYKTKKRQRY